MQVINAQSVPEQKIEEGANNAAIRWILTDNEGAHKFYMRIIDLDHNGYTPHHGHPWEHEFYVLEGTGRLVGEDGLAFPLGPGDAGIVPAGEAHHFESAPGTSMRFICLIPSKKC